MIKESRRIPDAYAFITITSLVFMPRLLTALFRNSTKPQYPVISDQIIRLFFHFPLRKRQISSAALIHQSITMARAIPMTPMPSH